jgi:putative restriction endonuclease
MAYWWVNHKQTYVNEIEGGYIWSPKKNSDGSKNQTYINLTLTRPGDFIISYASAEIKAIGVIASKCREQLKPSEYGTTGAWSNIGWAVPIVWQILSSPLKPKRHIGRIAPLLPKKHSPLQPNGNGNQSCYLASLSDELGSLILELAQPMNLEVLTELEDDRNEIEELSIVEELKTQQIESTEKDQIIKARKGQGKFRKNVEKIEKKCRVTGITNKSLLIASHIKPWKSSNNAERLDGNNGLMLSPHIDSLFDKGWISFLATGDLICANDGIASVLADWGVKLPINVGNFNSTQTKYLNFHLEKIYKG